MPIITLQDGWNRLEEKGIRRLQHIIRKGSKEKFTNEQHSELYTVVYDMCTQKVPHYWAPQLYDRYRKSITDYLESVVLPAIQAKSGEFLVKELVKRWHEHSIMQKVLVNMFAYLDRFFVKRNNKKPLREVSISRFRSVVFNAVHKKATAAILALIQQDRQGRAVDRTMLHDAIHMYVALGTNNTAPSFSSAAAVAAFGPGSNAAAAATAGGSTDLYKSAFLGPFLQATNDAYGREAAQWLVSDPCPEYLRKVELRIVAERQRLADYLHPSSEKELMRVLYSCLLIKHQSRIINQEGTGVRAMMAARNTTDLDRLYKLYRAVPESLPKIANILKEHILERGNALISTVNQRKDHSTYVVDLMQLHETYHAMVLGSFEGDAVFHKSLKDAFETIVNTRTFQCSTAELLATHANSILQIGGDAAAAAAAAAAGGNGSRGVDQILEHLVRLFAYLTDKDVFSEYYRKALSKRLLLQRSASLDAEKSMIGKLKVRCGAQFTSKLEGMINDIRNLDDQQRNFARWLSSRPGKPVDNIDFSVQTLTTGFWPTYKTDECKLPAEMEKCIDAFKQYYDEKTKNRCLRWIHELGVVTLAGHFQPRRTDLVVTTVQASLLLYFNAQKEISISQLITMSGLPPASVKRNLRTLVSGKFKILQKKPSEGYDVTHIMRVNPNYTHQQRRVRVPMVAMKAAQRNQTQQVVAEDRRHAIEAKIVRVMKARKTLKHQQLVVDVSAQLLHMFRPDPRQIKRRIEDLIAREYMERDKDDSNLYHYCA